MPTPRSLRTTAVARDSRSTICSLSHPDMPANPEYGTADPVRSGYSRARTMALPGKAFRDSMTIPCLPSGATTLHLARRMGRNATRFRWTPFSPTECSSGFREADSSSRRTEAPHGRRSMPASRWSSPLRRKTAPNTNMATIRTTPSSIRRIPAAGTTRIIAASIASTGRTAHRNNDGSASAITCLKTSATSASQ